MPDIKPSKYYNSTNVLLNSPKTVYDMQVFKVAIGKHVTAVIYAQLIPKIATRDRAERNFRPLDGQWPIY